MRARSKSDPNPIRTKMDPNHFNKIQYPYAQCKNAMLP